MNESIKSVMVAVIMVAIVTVFVLPREDLNAGSAIKKISNYMRWAISYSTGGQDIPSESGG